jgi:hypothetical protein
LKIHFSPSSYRGEEGIMKKKFYIGTFNEIGQNTIDLEFVIKDWNHLWFISKYGVYYTLIKRWSKTAKEALRFKSRISKKQAKELIKRLKLSETKSPIFRLGSTFRN